jgi:hypothetical protein
MGKSSRGTRWGEYGYREPGEKRCLANLSAGGTSGAQFADYVGIKYSTFATWIQKRQRHEASGLGGAIRAGC